MSNYRPQYAYPPAPLGWEDEQFHYSFDSTNTPLLSTANALAAGAFSNNIILPMDSEQTNGKGVVFFARAIKIRLGTLHSSLNFQLRTPHGDYMQAVPVPIALYASRIDGKSIAGQYFIPFEAEIESPAGSNWTLYLYNPTSGSVNPPSVTLVGVKRRMCGVRRAA